MREVLDVTKALADGSRLRVLMALGGGELGAKRVSPRISVSPPTGPYMTIAEGMLGLSGFGETCSFVGEITRSMSCMPPHKTRLDVVTL